VIRADGWRIKLDGAQIKGIAKSPEMLADLTRRMTRAQLAAKTIVGVRTGRLQSSIRKNAGSTAKGVYVDVIAGWKGAGLGASYMWYHHEGTPPHIIRPRKRKALRFIQGGKVRFAQKVHHPGTRGTHFLTRALPFAAG
jgi:hypothetical protein